MVKKITSLDESNKNYEKLLLQKNEEIESLKKQNLINIQNEIEKEKNKEKENYLIRSEKIKNNSII